MDFEEGSHLLPIEVQGWTAGAAIEATASFLGKS